MLRGRAAEKGLALEIDIEAGFPASIHADSTKVRQILINVIGNAIKFTDHGSVMVHARLQEANADHAIACIEVTDTGTGIGQHDRERIFEAFEQTVAGRGKGGTGLGLTISREYAQMMGGGLSIDSAPGRGSVVRFTFQAVPAMQEAGATGPARNRTIAGIAPGSAKPKILVVDDSGLNREILRLILNGVGLTTIREAANGSEALRILRDWQPDVVLMDRRMPGMDGLQATLAIRELPQGREIRIIIVTASAFEEDRQAAITFGADGFVSKPFREEEILVEIRRVFPTLEFRYEEQKPPTVVASSPGDYRSEAGKLDAGVRAELLNLIECGDVKRFEQVITSRLRDKNPALYARLHTLLEKFDYAQILMILEAPKLS
jgi:CheY-like chemotaxis protein